jgi:hypothetical protein
VMKRLFFVVIALLFVTLSLGSGCSLLQRKQSVIDELEVKYEQQKALRDNLEKESNEIAYFYQSIKGLAKLAAKHIKLKYDVLAIYDELNQGIMMPDEAYKDLEYLYRAEICMRILYRRWDTISDHSINVGIATDNFAHVRKRGYKKHDVNYLKRHIEEFDENKRKINELFLKIKNPEKGRSISYQYIIEKYFEVNPVKSSG